MAAKTSSGVCGRLPAPGLRTARALEVNDPMLSGGRLLVGLIVAWYAWSTRMPMLASAA